MKRYLHSLLLLSLVGTISAKTEDDCCRVEYTPDDSCDYEITSRSYLSVRPHFLSDSPEKISGFRSDRLRTPEDGNGVAAQAVLYGSQSVNERDIARYFFPLGKTVLIVDERIETINNSSPPLPMDLRASHFNIFTNDGDFRSKISIRPEQTVIGVGFHAKKSFWVDEDKGRSFYGSLSFAAERVKNNLHFFEEVLDNGGGPNLLVDDHVMANMTEAFMQSEWKFGKIDRQARRRTGVADIEFKIGYEWIQQEPFHLESYLGALIPTSRKPQAEYMFDPVVGQGHHVGIIFGNHVGVEIWKDEAKDRKLRVEYSGHSQYLLRNTQCRSIDLVNKPWSRYISMYSSEAQATMASTLPVANNLDHNFATPGINILTLPLKVRPGFSHNMTTAAVLKMKNWILEGGYNLYCRQAECVELECPWCEGPAIKRDDGTNGINDGRGNTNPVRDITGNYRLENVTQNVALVNYKQNMIKSSDLDLLSATTPCTITSTIYGTVGYRWDDRDWPLFGNLGGSYEFSNSHNGVLERWTIWAKLGVSL
ncbi:hypothetical protein E3J61_00825 [Candidatus Dependentiae bacterium]|nr:MAG: hypothetical protein E3J61_00825 [Candidatus Dependentiae bacterium]